jgi:hypothetical protein
MSQMQTFEMYMFVDERIIPTEQHIRLIVGCLVVWRRRWEALYSEAKKVGATRRQRRLDGPAGGNVR